MKKIYPKDVMIDLETLGVDDDCIILSIGACFFNIGTGGISENTFYKEVSIASQTSEGTSLTRSMTVSTLEFWLSQGSAKQVFNTRDSEKDYLMSGLVGLSDFINQDEFDDTTVWGNGATFDISILTNAYKQGGLLIPWAHYNVNDVRTVRRAAKYHGIRKEDFPFKGTKHNALDDAIHQATYVSGMWQAITKNTLKDTDHAVWVGGDI